MSAGPLYWPPNMLFKSASPHNFPRETAEQEARRKERELFWHSAAKEAAQRQLEKQARHAMMYGSSTFRPVVTRVHDEVLLDIEALEPRNIFHNMPQWKITEDDIRKLEGEGIRGSDHLDAASYDIRIDQLRDLSAREPLPWQDHIFKVLTEGYGPGNPIPINGRDVKMVIFDDCVEESFDEEDFNPQDIGYRDPILLCKVSLLK